MHRPIVVLLLAVVCLGHRAQAQSPVERALLEATRTATRTTCSGTVMVPESTGDERMALPVPTAASSMPRIVADCVPARRLVPRSSQARSLALETAGLGEPALAALTPLDVPRPVPRPNGASTPRPR